VSDCQTYDQEDVDSTHDQVATWMGDCLWAGKVQTACGKKCVTTVATRTLDSFFVS